MAASLVNFNLVLVRFQASAFTQQLAALVSLAVLLVVGIVRIVRIFDFAAMTSDFVIPSVLAWAAVSNTFTCGTTLLRTLSSHSFYSQVAYLCRAGENEACTKDIFVMNSFFKLCQPM